MQLQNIQGFKPANPATLEHLRLAQKHGVMFLKSDDGRDWYECQKLFQSDTIKLCYDGSNIIRSITSGSSGHDVSSLWPLNMNVAEVRNTTANRRADINGGWLFVDGEIIRREATGEELVLRAENEKAKRIADATATIVMLTDAVELGIATDEEAARLIEWKKYRVLLSRVDAKNAPQITWPELPA